MLFKIINNRISLISESYDERCDLFTAMEMLFGKNFEFSYSENCKPCDGICEISLPLVSFKKEQEKKECKYSDLIFFCETYIQKDSIKSWSLCQNDMSVILLLRDGSRFIEKFTNCYQAIDKIYSMSLLFDKDK